MNFAPIETRGEARKRKDRERKAAKRAIAGRHAENSKFRKKRENARSAVTAIRIHNDRQAAHTGISLRVLDMDNDFQKATQDHAMWPQTPLPEVARGALSEFRDNVSLDSLRESPCAVCSGI
jgi:hypothetical protein